MDSEGLCIFIQPYRIWNAREISIASKLIIFRSNFKPVLLRGLETRKFTHSITKNLQTFIKECLKTIF